MESPISKSNSIDICKLGIQILLISKPKFINVKKLNNFSYYFYLPQNLFHLTLE